MALGKAFKKALWYGGRIKDAVANALDNAGAMDLGPRIPASEAARLRADADLRIKSRNARRRAAKPF